MRRFSMFMVLAMLCGVASFANAGQRWNPATRPTFPILQWDVPAKNFDAVKSRGVNVLIGCGLEVADTPASRMDWANKAAAKGFWVIADFQGQIPDNVYAFLLPDEMDAKQANPNVPKWDGLTRDQIRPLYDAFKRLAPDVPVLMSCAGDHVNNSAARVAYYASIVDCSDMWMEDGYPRSKNGDRYDEKLWPGSAVKVLKTVAPKKPCFAMLETGWQHLQNSPNGRAPTAAEHNDAWQQAVDNGADGVGLFTHYFNGNGGWVGWDNTTPDVEAVIRQWTAKLTPQTDPVTRAMQSRIAALEAGIAERDARINSFANDLSSAVRKLATTQPTTQP